MAADTARTDFWSRRRAAVEAEVEGEAAALRAAEAARIEAEREAGQAEKTDAEILAELGLSDPDTLVQGDDFSAFMKAAVPERLRQRALRRLWRSNPVLANLDGLIDYGDDYTDAATVIPGMQTAYQVGKGMMRHVIALAEQAEAEAAAAAANEDEGEPEVIEAEVAEAAPEVAPYAVAPAVAKADEAPATAPRRHMRFAFAG